VALSGQGEKPGHVPGFFVPAFQGYSNSFSAKTLFGTSYVFLPGHIVMPIIIAKAAHTLSNLSITAKTVAGTGLLRFPVRVS